MECQEEIATLTLSHREAIAAQTDARTSAAKSLGELGSVCCPHISARLEHGHEMGRLLWSLHNGTCLRIPCA